MAKFQIYRSNLDAARERCTLSPEEHAQLDELVANQTGSIAIDVETLPIPFARALLQDSKLRPNQRAILTMYVHGLKSDDLDWDRVYRLRVSSPLEFGSAVSSMTRGKANAEMFWNGRWYPVMMLIDLHEDEQKLAKNVSIRVSLGMGQTTRDVVWPLHPQVFLDESGEPVELTVLEVMEKLGFRRLQIPPAQHNLRLLNAERLAASEGTQVWVKASVLGVRARHWFGAGLELLPLGTEDVPRRAVVEPVLDADEHGHAHYGGFRTLFAESVSRVPLVRVFSLETKDYVFADVDDLAVYEYDETALSRLYLPEEMKSVLRKIFETPQEQLFGDLIRGKHGGIVILACGSPGVGKTLTAEVYAEMTSRPLYVLEFGEMGTTVEQIENNLDRIFARVVRWRAVLQFDECEIFLSQRGEDLERSAIVGVFLRMLDYYEGLLFLTTNRPDALDHAIRSRVMLRLDYPDLDVEARTKIWRTMFEAAGLTLTQGTFGEVASAPVNGRQIRNLVRLARILHPGREVSASDIQGLLGYGSH